VASRKGVPNRNKDYLIKRLADMFGDDFDPIIKAAQAAVEMDRLTGIIDDEDKGKIAALKECVNAWDKVAQYCQPKLKAIELDMNADIEHRVGKVQIEVINANPDD